MKIKTTPKTLHTLRKLKRITNDPALLGKIYRMDGNRLVDYIAKTLFDLGLYPTNMTLTNLAAELDGHHPEVSTILRTAIKRFRQRRDKDLLTRQQLIN